MLSLPANTMFRAIRNAFLTGVLVILPLGVTVIIISFLLEKLGTPASNLFFWFLDRDLREQPQIQLLLEAISVLVVFILITLLGFGSRLVIGRMLLNTFERALDRLPFINSVYRTVKQIVDTFSQQKKAVFQEVVLLEYPRSRSYVIGFLTGKASGETQAVTGESIVNVFIPTTPNPTSGFLLMLPEEDITRLEMSVVDGMKLIISGGAVVPPYNPSQAVTIDNPKSAEAEAPGTFL
ncbi:DUF502 domain-containing protein [Coraliomargarita parva]|uniref:DUF502 domain-containing protein n=1 Tax=Coraliomargarita parva TaxID=3014050 RepID=UPI0022B2E581|nr:DUF502 domain-containing protein [Coraliomargarita parva]